MDASALHTPLLRLRPEGSILTHYRVLSNLFFFPFTSKEWSVQKGKYNSQESIARVWVRKSKGTREGKITCPGAHKRKGHPVGATSIEHPRANFAWAHNSIV